MKLSMWMIANRLTALDPELQIRDNAPICLRSARRAYATDCVFVYQDGRDTVCDGEGDKIILKDMSCSQAFEIVQCIFDFYDDWYASVQDALQHQDYQRLVDDSWTIFHNPLILLDADCCVLALSNQYAENDINSEWRHLCRYGYSSVNYIRQFKTHYDTKDFYVKNKAQLFTFGRELENSVTMSTAVYDKDIFCGRLNLLQKDREINWGDKQLLEFLVPSLAASLGSQKKDKDNASPQNVFMDLVLALEIDQSKLHQRLLWQLKYMKWDMDDIFQTAVLWDHSLSLSQDLLILISNLVRKQLPQVNVFLDEQYIVLVYDLDRTPKKLVMEQIQDIVVSNGLLAGFSLPLRNLDNLIRYYHQALAAIEYGQIYSPEDVMYQFYDYALYYLIETGSMDELLCACHPDIKMLYENDQRDGAEVMHTLNAYLNNDCSLVNAAKELFIHRNTMVYRMNKIMDMVHYNLEDVYCQDYMKMSIRIMDLFHRKYKTPLDRMTHL